MFSDIAIPKNNEEKFIEIASKLGIKKMFFLYDIDEYNEGKFETKLETILDKKIKLEIGFIVSQKNLKKALKSQKFLAAKSSENDRFLIESKKIKLIYGLEETSRKDYIHQKASGLNHIICGIARKNNVVIGFSYEGLINSEQPKSAVLMGRMMQNISLCQKYKVKTVIGSFSGNPLDLRAPHDIAALFGKLGMNSKALKESTYFSF